MARCPKCPVWQRLQVVHVRQQALIVGLRDLRQLRVARAGRGGHPHGVLLARHVERVQAHPPPRRRHVQAAVVGQARQRGIVQGVAGLEGRLHVLHQRRAHGWRDAGRVDAAVLQGGGYARLDLGRLHGRSERALGTFRQALGAGCQSCAAQTAEQRRHELAAPARAVLGRLLAGGACGHARKSLRARVGGHALQDLLRDPLGAWCRAAHQRSARSPAAAHFHSLADDALHRRVRLRQAGARHQVVQHMLRRLEAVAAALSKRQVLALVEQAADGVVCHARQRHHALDTGSERQPGLGG